jgi:nucleotide-binding universal stress UspA family protein
LLNHASAIARREQARLLALFVDDGKENLKSTIIETAAARFEASCKQNEIRGDFAVESGSLSRKLIERAAWTDLVVIGFRRQKSKKTTTGFGSHFNRILQRSPRPVLVVPESAASPLDRALLAYDGSAKAGEALYLAAYMAKNWGISLVVVVAGDDLASRSLNSVRNYLSYRDVAADFITAQRPAFQAILSTADAEECNFIIMGGYGYRPIMQLVLGSTVTRVIRRSTIPVLVCR